MSPHRVLCCLAYMSLPLQAQPMSLLPRLNVVAVVPLANGCFLICCKDGRLHLLLPNQPQVVGSTLKLPCQPK